MFNRKLALTLALTASTSLAFGGLIGCSGFSGAAALPDATVNPAVSPIGTISGNNYGGHAPLAGAHIYLVEPGNTGYGSAVKSLITSTGSNVTQNGNWTNSGSATDQFVPSSAYGILAAADSSYTLTGDYTCDVGRPVWVIGYGGSPTFPAGNTSFQVNQIVVSNLTGSGSTETATYTMTATTTENFYVGEPITLSNFTGNFSFLAAAETVLSTNLTTTTFAITGADNSGGIAAGTYTNTGTVTANPAFNPAAVNVASLGVCPSNGTLAGTISYIYMNEISTTAWAYAFNQFGNWAVNDQSGNNEFNVGAAGTTQGAQALVNAAYAAAALYDIQGSSVTTSYAGEGHIARTTTPNGGFGTVPQATLDTLGNILAACVDSNNTYRLQAGTVSPQCNTLETYATDNGVYDSTTTIQTATQTHVAFNIAQAALNIAHYPQGNGTGTTSNGTQTITSAGTSTTAANFVNALYNLPTGNLPFTPNLVSTGAGAPNDFSVPILWNVGAANSDVEIDATGNAWVAAATSGLYEITPQGVLSNITGSANNLSSALSAGLAIDNNASVWAAGTTGSYVYAPAVGVNGIDGTSNATQSAGIAVDNLAQSSGGPYQYIASGDDGNATGTYTPQIVKQVSVGGASAGGNFPIVGNQNGTANTAATCAYAVGFITLDSSNNIWTASSQNVFAFQQPYVCRFDSNGNVLFSYQVPNGVSGQAENGTAFPRGLATDAGDNIWFSDKNLDGIYYIPKGTTTVNTGGVVTTDHTRLRSPSWVAVDGANTIWVSNSGDAGATTGGKYASGLVQFNDSGTVLTPSYITGTTLSTSPTTCLNSVAIDPSGNVWSSQGTGQSTCTTATQVNEYIGLAAPTRTPISVAKGATAAGTKP